MAIFRRVRIGQRPAFSLKRVFDSYNPIDTMKTEDKLTNVNLKSVVPQDEYTTGNLSKRVGPNGTQGFPIRTYSREVVSQHTSSGSTWIIIDNRVYDVTHFLGQVSATSILLINQ